MVWIGGNREGKTVRVQKVGPDGVLPLWAPGGVVLGGGNWFNDEVEVVGDDAPPPPGCRQSQKRRPSVVLRSAGPEASWAREPPRAPNHELFRFCNDTCRSPWYSRRLRARGLASTGLPAAAGMRRHQASKVLPYPKLEAQMRGFPRHPLVPFLCLVFLFVVGGSWAADLPGRVSPPPQLGFQPAAPDAPSFIADRVLVKLTDHARRSSRVPASTSPHCR